MMLWIGNYAERKVEIGENGNGNHQGGGGGGGGAGKYHAIVGNSVPILPSDDANKQSNGLWSSLEVCMSSKVLAVLDRAKEEHASKSIAQHEQEHAQYDEEGFQHRHHHRQHQHFQASLYISQSYYSILLALLYSTSLTLFYSTSSTLLYSTLLALLYSTLLALLYSTLLDMDMDVFEIKQNRNISF